MSSTAPLRSAASDLGRAAADRLLAPVDASSLATFRILFGGLMLWDVVDALRLGRVQYRFLQPHFLFSYDLFPFVRPWPADLLYAHFALMGLAALGLALGLFYRWSAALFFLAYTYVFLLDKAQYNNHYYLIVLLSFLLCVVDAHAWMSLDRRRRPGPAVVPFWNLFLLRAQVVLVFFFAGVAKLNGDWLAGEPMRTWLGQREGAAWIGPWLATDAAAYLFSYAGLVFDLSAGVLLLWRRTRIAALLALLGFNLVNDWLFDIGVFPVLMLAAAVLFVEPDLPRRLLGQGESALRAAARSPISPHRRAAVLAFVVLYLAVQVLLPLRHWLYPGYVGWTEEGQRFSWLMKLRSKSGYVVFCVTDGRAGHTWEVDAAEDLNLEQRRRLAFSPDLILQYAQFLRRDLEGQGVTEPVIRAATWVSLNRRPPQRLIDPEADLTQVRPGRFDTSSWIVPLDSSGRPGTLGLREYAALLDRTTQGRRAKDCAPAPR